jgi:serine/threonine protein kinase
MNYDIFIEKYPLGRIIGSGSDGKIHDSVSNTVVKIGTDLVNEIRFYKLLDHPRMFKLLDYCAPLGSNEQMLCIPKGIKVMIDAVQFMYESLSFLNYLYDEKIAHCDIKPYNIVQYEGHLKFIDFNLARRAKLHNDKLYITGIAYTEGYKDPEYLDDCDNPIEVELYALAITVYGLYVGEDDPLDQIACTLHDYPELDEIITLMTYPLSKRPNVKFLLCMSIFDKFRNII